MLTSKHDNFATSILENIRLPNAVTVIQYLLTTSDFRWYLCIHGRMSPAEEKNNEQLVEHGCEHEDNEDLLVHS